MTRTRIDPELKNAVFGILYSQAGMMNGALIDKDAPLLKLFKPLNEAMEAGDEDTAISTAFKIAEEAKLPENKITY